MTAICIRLILYDANLPGELDRAEAFGSDILKLCVDVGGVLSGEHGVGIEKRDLMTYQFGPLDLEVAAPDQTRVRSAVALQSRQWSFRSWRAAVNRVANTCTAMRCGTPRCRASEAVAALVEYSAPARPGTESELVELLSAPGPAFELVAGGTKRGVGKPVAAPSLDLSALSGIRRLSAGELVLTVRPATPLREIEALHAAQRQRLAFEPPTAGHCGQCGRADPGWGADGEQFRLAARDGRVQPAITSSAFVR